MSESSTSLQNQLPNSANIATKYVTVGQTVVLFELHTLTGDGQRHGLVEWPAQYHIKDILKIVTPIIEARLKKAGRKWTHKDASKPKLIFGDTIRMAYSFKENHMQMHFMIQNQGEYAGYRMFVEKLVVYACPIRKHKTTSTTNQETTSIYFNDEKTGSDKQRLPQPLFCCRGGQKKSNACEKLQHGNTAEERVERNIGVQQACTTPINDPLKDNTSAYAPPITNTDAGTSVCGFINETATKDMEWSPVDCFDDVLPLLLNNTMRIPSTCTANKTEMQRAGDENTSSEETCCRKSSKGDQSSQRSFISGCERLSLNTSTPSKIDPCGLRKDIIQSTQSNNVNLGKRTGYVRKAKGRWRRLMEVMELLDDDDGVSCVQEEDEDKELTNAISDTNSQPKGKQTELRHDSCDSASSPYVKRRRVNVTRDITLNKDKGGCPSGNNHLQKRKSEETSVKASKLQIAANTVTDICKIDNMSEFSQKVDTTQNTMDDDLMAVRIISDLTVVQTIYLVHSFEGELHAIFQGKIPSRRHQIYKKGGKEKYDLKYQIPMRCFSDDQHDAIMQILLSIFCYKHNDYLDYVLKVLLPEILIMIYAKVHQLTNDEAEEALSLPTPKFHFSL